MKRFSYYIYRYITFLARDKIKYANLKFNMLIILIINSYEFISLLRNIFFYFRKTINFTLSTFHSINFLEENKPESV